MPSSYSFNSSAIGGGPSSYRPSATPGPPSHPATSSTDTNNLNTNNSNKTTKDYRQNNDQNNGSKNNQDVDIDARWKANYVPTLYDKDAFSNSAASNDLTASSSASGPDLDAKWRSNYVPTPYDGQKLSLVESGSLAPAGHALASKPGPQEPRSSWSNKAEFVLACTGYSIGIGNVVRLPYLVYKYGGGAFLIPYVLFLFLVGLPLYFLELGLGQYAQLGPVNAWHCTSALQGLGLSMAVLSVLSSVYYSQLLAYCLHYLMTTLAYIGYQLPWATCQHTWAAADYCYEVDASSTAGGVLLGHLVHNTTTTIITVSRNTSSLQSAAQHYFRYKVRNEPVLDGPSSALGLLRWDLALCLLGVWVLVFLTVVKGVRSVGKVACVTTTLGIIGLVTLMINGIMMKGAQQGLSYMFFPSWDKLSHMGVWKAALQHVLFSLGLSTGGVIMYGSHNPFRNKVHYDALAICLIDLILSILACVTVFSVLGAMAYALQIEDVSLLPDIDQSLAFVTLPSAISRALPAPHFWTLVLFGTLMAMGGTTLMGHVFTLMGAVQDCLTRLRANSLTVAGAICCCCFLLTLPLCAESHGYYLLGAVSEYGVGLSVLAVALAELLTLSWVYGIRRLSEDFAYMLGYTPSMFWRVCWAFVAPLTVLVMFLYTLVILGQPSLGLPPTPWTPSSAPSWGGVMGWLLVLASLGLVPLVFLWMVLKRGWNKEMGRLFSPALSWGPGDQQARRELLAARDAGAAGVDNPAMAFSE